MKKKGTEKLSNNKTLRIICDFILYSLLLFIFHSCYSLVLPIFFYFIPIFYFLLYYLSIFLLFLFLFLFVLFIFYLFLLFILFLFFFLIYIIFFYFFNFFVFSILHFFFFFFTIFLAGGFFFLVLFFGFFFYLDIKSHQGDQAGHVQPLLRLGHGVAHDHIVDALFVQSGQFLHHVGDGLRGQFVRPFKAKSATRGFPHGGSECFYDICVFHGFVSLV